ncbi:4-(cytidine 5'-diphospho)-2-C-methyl-D-erythritol kinase [Wolbachia endosymbiont of Howardula sp.]|uniref:4-(cytidine 5'-diphospho)-2-C-methyl-D-erythritol kinase n=1 Tax=Wolbachia endosymbiont of Howardula sp. TaxID=2916816 RepID=UPI00217EC65E|nr:4-(cytidine 5'-diphospho)-2-C-methyl-D-erythritol kinase [Wolbachia endosymbiont of Howardula sp.]UWI83299.1 4-(cytidine 5'-diphospho)-2-C-methyl-D-erythritol kinase [Wolbachia endosymbiont of Howardula sp.]
MTRFCIKAPAKINLFLHLVDKQKTGYHIIESIMCFTTLANIVEIQVSDKHYMHNPSVTVEFFHCESSIDHLDNTVIKAVQLMLKYAPAHTQVSVKIVKNIPTASGLGSGSADAGAVIRTLGRLWKIKRQILHNIALKIGSDVPSSIYSQSVFVQGIGEQLLRLKNFFLPIYVILVKPKNKFLKTSEVFYKYTEPFSKPITWNIYSQKVLYNILQSTKNDLQDIAISLVPEIKHIITELNSQQGSIFARMSGSGVGCFGIFDNEKNAQYAATNMTLLHPDWWICSTQLIV